MQVVVMLIFLGVWLLIFWLGAVALETTGLERRKARFQSLSALTGTGFTTTEAESIVNHPQRRRIATWLIFIGNAGIISFIILMIFSLRTGLTALSVRHIVIIIGSFVIFLLLMKLGVIDSITSGMVRIIRGKGSSSPLMTEQLLYQRGDYGIARVLVTEEGKEAGIALKDTGLSKEGITVLAIERGDSVLSLPEADEAMLVGDCVVCYGRIPDIISTS